jgi:hypothetical protein
MKTRATNLTITLDLGHAKLLPNLKNTRFPADEEHASYQLGNCDDHPRRTWSLLLYDCRLVLYSCSLVLMSLIAVACSVRVAISA